MGIMNLLKRKKRLTKREKIDELSIAMRKKTGKGLTIAQKRKLMRIKGDIY